MKIGALELKNPIMVASGTFGYGEEFNENFYPIKEIGAVVTKGISLEPREGNPPPRVVETLGGMINSIGLANVGVKEFLRTKLPYLEKAGATVIVNIFGSTVEEYAEVAGRLDGASGVSALEVNISCPNVACGGMQFGVDPEGAAKVTAAVRKKTRLPLIVKLSPNVADITVIGEAAEGEGADAVSAINTIAATAGGITGGLSGPAIKPVALKMVRDLCGRLKIPVIGVGGIRSITDVAEFLNAGAVAVQIGTANFVDPMIAHRLVGELEEYCRVNGD